MKEERDKIKRVRKEAFCIQPCIAYTPTRKGKQQDIDRCVASLHGELRWEELCVLC